MKFLERDARVVGQDSDRKPAEFAYRCRQIWVSTKCRSFHGQPSSIPNKDPHCGSILAHTHDYNVSLTEPEGIR